VPPPGPPAPAPPAPASPAAESCGADTAQTGQRPARRTFSPRMPGSRRQTASPSTRSPPHARRARHQPAAARSDCAPGSKTHRTSGKTPPQRRTARRSSPPAARNPHHRHTARRDAAATSQDQQSTPTMINNRDHSPSPGHQTRARTTFRERRHEMAFAETALVGWLGGEQDPLFPCLRSLTPPP
jgi:hypothetical protein